MIMSSEIKNCFNRSLYNFFLIIYLILKGIFQLFLFRSFLGGLVQDTSNCHSKNHLEAHRLLKKLWNSEVF